MTRSTRSGPGAPDTRRQEYQSLDNHPSDDERPFSSVKNDAHSPHRGNAMHDAYLDDLLSSDDDSPQDNANVKLLPLDKKAQQQKRVQLNSTASSASASSPIPGDESGEPRNVSKAIEQMLDRERDILSETFDEDLNHVSHPLMDGGDSDDYGFPGYKDSDTRRYKVQKPDWKSGIKSLLHITAWWHVFPLAVFALLVIWLATKGLPWVMYKNPVKEYVRVLLFMEMRG